MKQSMRVLKTVAVVVLASLALVMFAACDGKKTDNANAPAANTSASQSTTPDTSAQDNTATPQGTTLDASTLVGTWEEVDIASGYVFNADGTGQESLLGATFDFTWELSGNKLVLTFGEDSIEEYTLSYAGGTLTMNDGEIDFEYKKK